jgi:hypothetical protein
MRCKLFEKSIRDECDKIKMIFKNDVFYEIDITNGVSIVVRFLKSACWKRVDTGIQLQLCTIL